LRPIEAGIVDEDVDALEPGKCVPHRVRLSDIERQRTGIAAAGSDLVYDFVELARRAAHQHQFGPGGGKR
jgi:hypothetical protein